MTIADRVARFNRTVTNPIQRLWAGRVPPWAVVEHVGRKSGRTYRTPVTAFKNGDRITVLLPYGTHRDWVRNLEAAGEGVLVRGGKRLRITEPDVRPGRIASLRLRVAAEED